MDSGELRIEKNEKDAGREALNDAELYEELGKLTKNPTERKENIPFLSGLLSHGSVKIQAKALWLPGEAGLRDPEAVSGTVKEIAAFLSSPIALLRKRTINALGRIGRGEFSVIEPYWKDMFHSAEDEDAGVRHALIWASENIASNTHDIYPLPRVSRVTCGSAAGESAIL